MTDVTTNTESNIVMPWQGSGVVVQNGHTVEAIEVMKKANLDWEVEGRTLGAARDENFMVWDKCARHKAVVRVTDNKVMGIVGAGWHILQNHEVFSFLDDLARGDQLAYHCAGSFKGGRIAWVQCKVRTSEIVSGDEQGDYLLFVNAFDGSFSVVITRTRIRVCCWNTFQAALREGKKGEFRIRHTASMKEKLDKAKRAIMVANQEGAEEDAFQKALLRLHMSSQMWNDFGMALIPDPEEGKSKSRAENARSQLLSLAVTGRGQDIPGVAGTGYAALNALTEYTNYHRTSRGDNDLAKQANRFQSTLFGSSGKLIDAGRDMLAKFLVDHSIQVDTVVPR
jgi:phage/plasmid-like protein (TIGR03299 family)